jgi:hypothetical protein
MPPAPEGLKSAASDPVAAMGGSRIPHRNLTSEPHFAGRNFML